MSYIDEIVGASVKNKGGMYRHSIPKLDLSVERYTGLVPGDGKFYVIHKGRILKSYRSRNKAEQYLNQFVKESDYKLKSVPIEAVDSINDDMGRYFRKKSSVW